MSAAMLWLVYLQKVPQTFERLCPAVLASLSARSFAVNLVLKLKAEKACMPVRVAHPSRFIVTG